MTDESVKEKSSAAEFLHTTRQELAKVTWPDRGETLKMTMVIIVFALVAGVFFLGVDWVLGYVISHLLSMNS